MVADQVDMVADQVDMVAEVDMVVEVEVADLVTTRVAQSDLVTTRLAQAGLVTTRAQATNPLVELTEVRLQPPGSTDPYTNTRRGFSQNGMCACTALTQRPIRVPPAHVRGILRQFGRSD